MNQISKEYAGALFSLALEQGCVRKWADELKVMLDALEEQPAYVQLLSSPEIPGEERAELLGKAFGGELSREPLSFAALMCRRGRARELPDAIRRFRDMADEAERIKHARVTSAFPLSEEEQERLRQRLSAISEGAVVVLECRVDPRLIGGVMVEMDGRILDGTVRTKLREIKEVIGG